MFNLNKPKINITMSRYIQEQTNKWLQSLTNKNYTINKNSVSLMKLKRVNLKIIKHFVLFALFTLIGCSHLSK